MKKILFFMLLGLFLSLIIGCEKDIIPPEPPTPLNVVVEPTGDTIVDVGEAVPYDIQTNADYMVNVTEESEDTIFHPGNFILPFVASKVGRNELHCRFFKVGSERILITRVVIGKDTVVPPPPEKPVILLLDSARVPSGTSYNIALVIKNALSVSSDIPGLTGTTGGIFPTGSLTHDTVFHVSASNEVGTTVDSIIIFVDPPPLPTPLLDAIRKYPWANVSASWKCDESDSWQDLIILPSWLAIKFVYGTDGQWRAYRFGNLIGSPCFYSIVESDSTLILGDLIFKIDYLIDTLMVLERQNSVHNVNCDDSLAFQLDNYVATTLK
jgi:hypothetical protein